MRTFLCSLLIMVALLALPPGLNASPAESFAQGQRSFERGRYHQAYDLFFEAFKEDPANLNYSFHLGRAAFQKGDFETAVMAFERILIADPGSVRVKLELARSYFELGSHELAKQYFGEVLETNPPEAVWQNIRKFLAAIEAAERRHFLGGILTLGIQYDDNVRVAPNENLIFVPFFGNDIPVEDGRSDWIINATMVINHVYKVLDASWAWKTAAINYSGFYGSQNDLNVLFWGLTTGPVRQTKRYLWETQALINHVRLDSDRYLEIYGLGTNLTLLFDDRFIFPLGVALQEKNFQDNKRDASNFKLQGGPVFIINKNRLGITLGWETENADDDRHSYKRASLGLRYDRLLPYNFAGFAAYRFENSKYDQPEPFFLVRRDDDKQEFTTGFSRTLWKAQDTKRSLAALLSYTHTRTDSNIAIYEYDKNLVATSLTLAF
jgi:outer membrane protein